MNITIYTTAYNEEKMLPFFLDHYSQFASKIVIYDNESTDDTVQIAKDHPLVSDIHTIKTGGCVDDSMYIDLKSWCWKDDDSDYVMLVDVDELIYHDNVVNYLKETKYSAYLPVGYNMISEDFPNLDISITDQIKDGVFDHMYNKPVIFNPNIIKDVEYRLGSHKATFYDADGIVTPIQSELKMLHYKNVGFDYRLNRHKLFSKRMSDFNQKTSSGIHYTWDTKTQKDEFNDILARSERVI